MGLLESYKEAMKEHFGSAGVIFPPTSNVRLGDYGFYQNGQFTAVDNVFKQSNKNLEDFINNSLGNSSSYNFLITNKEATSTTTEISGNTNSLQAEISYSLNSESGFVIQLMKVRTTSIFLNSDFKNLLKSLRERGLWKNSYRFVWQVWEADIKFTSAKSSQAKVVISAIGSKELTNLADFSLTFNHLKSSSVSVDFWKNDNVKSIPLANFGRFNIFGSPKPVKNLSPIVEDMKPFDEEVIIPDNSWS